MAETEAAAPLIAILGGPHDHLDALARHVAGGLGNAGYRARIVAVPTADGAPPPARSEVDQWHGVVALCTPELIEDSWMRSTAIQLAPQGVRFVLVIVEPCSIPPLFAATPCIDAVAIGCSDIVPHLLPCVRAFVDDAPQAAKRRGQARRRASDRATPGPADDETRFAAYTPDSVATDSWSDLLCYVYSAASESDVQVDAANALLAGGSLRGHAATAPGLERGTTVEVTPRIDDFDVNPPQLAVRLEEPWHRLGFRIKSKTPPSGTPASGSIEFAAEGVVVADVPVSISVGLVHGGPPAEAVPRSASTNVFASYSHVDTNVVDRVAHVCKALGLGFLRDVTHLRSGDRWERQLLDMVDEASIFQLFWSEAAARSCYVRLELNHALALVEAEVKPRDFIRPCYWHEPMVTRPDGLADVHFAFVPELGSRDL